MANEGHSKDKVDFKSEPFLVARDYNRNEQVLLLSATCRSHRLRSVGNVFKVWGGTALLSLDCASIFNVLFAY